MVFTAAYCGCTNYAAQQKQSREREHISSQDYLKLNYRNNPTNNLHLSTIPTPQPT
jgi:hypothetical protein